MLKIDLHIHSTLSGHAYGTIYDIINEAKKKKMDMIALTEHGPALPSSIPYFHFRMGRWKPKWPVKVLWGVEANPIDHNGNIDLDKESIDIVDLVIIGLHPVPQFKDLGR